jgi:hypothetical protein
VSESYRPGDSSPELPQEYAEAYRRGYERAYQDAAEGATHRGTMDSPGPEGQGSTSDDTTWVEPQRDPGPSQEGEHTAVLHGLDGAFLDDGEFAERERREQEDYDGYGGRPRWLVPALLGALVLVLLIAAYGLGKVFSDNVGSEASASNSNGVAAGPAHGSAYQGPTQQATVGNAVATCQAADGVDAAGNQVAYAPSNVYDGDATTAWRCDGSGVGQKLTLSLPQNTNLGSVGLIPGYAKTDPTSGANRYAENNRVTKVRWSFSDGSSVVQRFNGSATDRRMQKMRIPKTTTNRVVITILDSTPGPRDTVAISEVKLGRIAG